MFYKTPQTEADRGVLHYMQAMRKLHETMIPPAEFKYLCTEDFVLQHGCFFTPKPLPKNRRPMMLKECFNNAFHVAVCNKSRYRYCEGFAAGVIPVHHAWLIDAEGNVIDPTWASRDCGVGDSYYGVELDLLEVAFTRKEGTSSLLGDYMRRFPALRGLEVREQRPFSPFQER